MSFQMRSARVMIKWCISLFPVLAVLPLWAQDLPSGCSSLMDAVLAEDVGCLEVLAKKGTDLNALQAGRPPLLLAVQEGKMKAVRFLLDHKADVNAVDSNGETALIVSCQKSRPDFMRLLLSRKPDIDAADGQGITPLMASADRGCDECIRLLMPEGAHVNASDHDGTTSLMMAASAGHKKTVVLLLMYGAELMLKDSTGKTVFDFPELSDNPKLKAFLALYQRRGMTPLMLAADQGEEGIVRWLLKRGANPKAKDSRGWTAARYAIKAGHADIAAFLSAPKR